MSGHLTYIDECVKIYALFVKIRKGGDYKSTNNILSRNDPVGSKRRLKWLRLIRLSYATAC